MALSPQRLSADRLPPLVEHHPCDQGQVAGNERAEHYVASHWFSPLLAILAKKGNQIVSDASGCHEGAAVNGLAGRLATQEGRLWIGLYGHLRAENPGYTSVSVPVPRGVLMQAIVEAMFVS